MRGGELVHAACDLEYAGLVRSRAMKGGSSVNLD